MSPRGKRSPATTGASSTTWPTAWPATTTTHRIWSRKRSPGPQGPRALPARIARRLVGSDRDERVPRRGATAEASTRRRAPGRPRTGAARRAGGRRGADRAVRRDPARARRAARGVPGAGRAVRRQRPVLRGDRRIAPACPSAPSGRASTAGAACCAPRSSPTGWSGHDRRHATRRSASSDDSCCRRTSTASSPTTSAWRSKRSLAASAEWRAELDEITRRARRRCAGCPTRGAGRVLGRGARERGSGRRRAPTTADAAERHVVAISPAEPEVARGLDRRCRGRRRRGGRGDRRARPQRGVVRTSPRSSRSTGRPGSDKGDPVSMLVPIGPLAGPPVRAAIRRCVVVRRDARGASASSAPLHAAGAESSSLRRRAPRHARRATPRRDASSRASVPSLARPRQAERHHRLGRPATTVRSRSSRGRHRVVDEGSRTYFESRLGWSSALVEPEPDEPARTRPPLDPRVRRGPAIVDRPTPTSSLATRADGTAAERLYRRRRHRPAPAPRGARHATAGWSARCAFLDIDDRRRRRDAERSTRREHAEGQLRSTTCPTGYERRARRRVTCSWPFTPPERRRCCSTATACSPCRCSSSGVTSTGTALERRHRRRRSPATARRATASRERRRRGVGAQRLGVHLRLRRAERRVRRGRPRRSRRTAEHGRGGRRLRARPLRLEARPHAAPALDDGAGGARRRARRSRPTPVRGWSAGPGLRRRGGGAGCGGAHARTHRPRRRGRCGR